MERSAATRFLTRRVLPLILRHVAAILAVGLVTLLLMPLRSYLGAQVAAILYLLPVILATVLWGLSAGILAGMASFLLYNYFFLPPYHTLFVHQTQDLITLVVFLFVAVVISQLIGQARAGIQLARSREWEATQMYAMISAIAGERDIPGIGSALARQARETFRARHVEVALECQPNRSPLILSEPPGVERQGEPTIRCPVATVHRQEGEIRLWLDLSALSDEETRLLGTFASQGALAIERVRLLQSEHKARTEE